MIRVEIGDLTTVRAEAIIRPVSTDFSPVTPSMRRLDEAAGPLVEQQCQRLGEMPVGSAAITAAGELPADFLIHVAVRSPLDNVSPAAVRRGLTNALRRLAEWDIATAALAPLGVGAGNLDAEEAAALMVPLLVEHARAGTGTARLTVVVEDDYERSAFEAALTRHGGPVTEPTGGDR